MTNDRRSFLNGMLTAGALAAPAAAQSGGASSSFDFLPFYARAQNYKSLKQSSYDTTGDNGDSWPIAPGATREVFNATGPGIITPR